MNEIDDLLAMRDTLLGKPRRRRGSREANPSAELPTPLVAGRNDGRVPMPKLTDVIPLLTEVKRLGYDRLTAACPCPEHHGPGRLMFGIRKDGQPTFRCEAGCDPQVIVGALLSRAGVPADPVPPLTAAAMPEVDTTIPGGHAPPSPRCDPGQEPPIDPKEAIQAIRQRKRGRGRSSPHEIAVAIAKVIREEFMRSQIRIIYTKNRSFALADGEVMRLDPGDVALRRLLQGRFGVHADDHDVRTAIAILADQIPPGEAPVPLRTANYLDLQRGIFYAPARGTVVTVNIHGEVGSTMNGQGVLFLPKANSGGWQAPEELPAFEKVPERRQPGCPGPGLGVARGRRGPARAAAGSGRARPGRRLGAHHQEAVGLRPEPGPGPLHPAGQAGGALPGRLQEEARVPDPGGSVLADRGASGGGLMNAMRTAPLADLRQGLHVSVSQLKAWLMCPKKYEFQYVVGAEPAHRPVSLAFGTAVHRALEAFYEGLQQGRRPTTEEIQDAFVDRWAVEIRDPLPLLFDEDQTADQARDMGTALLATFCQQGFLPDEVIAVEQPFGMELVHPETGEVGDIPLVGAIDLVARHQDRVWLIEHKTAARRFTPDRIQYDFQPTSYLLSARNLGLPNPAAAFQILLKTKKPACETIPLTRTQAAEREFIDTAFQVLKGIEAGSFPRNRGWGCGDCQYRQTCGA